MRRILDLGLRGAAAIVVLFGLAACGNGAGPGDGGGGGDTDAAPTVSISSPSDGASFASGESISFAGSANDDEDGDLTSSLTWTSDLDGSIGSGGSFSAVLGDGTHVVAASATDSAAQTTSGSVTITVGSDGGGGGGGGGSGSTRDVGFVVVEESHSEGDGSLVMGNGGFWRFDGDVPDAFFDDPWGTVVGTCDVFAFDDIPDDPTFGLPVPDGLGITFLEAGASLSVTADGAAFLELDRYEASFGGETLIGYTSGDGVAGTAGGELALTVPGDEFPAVAGAVFPSSATFDLTAPADPGAIGSVSETTTFTWAGATNADDTIVSIDLVSTDFMTTVSCFAPDTGSFELPAGTIAELGGSFSGSVEAAGRESVRVEAVGDARLLLSLSRSQTFDVVLF